MADSRVKIQQFSGNREDFDTWKRTFMAIASIEGCTDLLRPNYAIPVGADANEIANNKKAHDRTSAKLYGLLITALDPDNQKIAEAKHLFDGWNAWKNLLDIYEKKDPIHGFHLHEQLLLTKLSDFPNVESCITHVTHTADKVMSTTGIDIPESQRCYIIAKSLGKDYKQWLVANSARLSAGMKINELRKELMEIEILLRGCKKNETQTNDSIFLARKDNRRSITNHSRDQPPRRNDKWCDHCRKANHTREECWTLKRKQQQQQRPNTSPYNGNNNSNHHPSPQRNTLGTGNNNSSSRQVAMVVNDINYESIDAPQNHNPAEWIVDTGASCHVCHQRDMFSEYEAVHDRGIRIANQAQLKAHGIGKVRLGVKTSTGEEIVITLTQVLHIPDCQSNLVSVKRLMQLGHRANFDKGKCAIITSNGEDVIPLIEGKDVPRLATINLNDDNAMLATNDITENDINDDEATQLDVWHARLGHTNADNIIKLSSKVNGLKLKNNDYGRCSNNCQVCAIGKMTKPPLATSETSTTRPLEMIHSDVFGPYRTPSLIRGERYLVSFIDGFSRFQMIYAIKNKSETLEKFKQFIAEMKRYTTYEPQAIQSDNGGEYISTDFRQYCLDHGIRQQLTIPHTPQQNGVSERNWRTIADMSRCMLEEAGLDDSYWALAAIYSAYIRNRTLTSATGNNKTPYEAITGNKPSIKHLRIFGSDVIYSNTDPKRAKFDGRGVRGIFVGFTEKTKGFVIYDPEQRKLKVTLAPHFYERIRVREGHVEVINKGRPKIPSFAKQLDTNSAIVLGQHQLEDDDTDNRAAGDANPNNYDGDGDEDEQPLIRRNDAAQQQVPNGADRQVLQLGAQLPRGNQAEAQVNNAPAAIPNINPNHDVNGSSSNDGDRAKDQGVRRSQRLGQSTQKRHMKDNIYVGNWFSGQRLYVAQEDTTATITAEVDEVISQVESKLARDVKTPTTIDEAMADPNWRTATEAEYNAIVTNGTWELVRLPVGRKPVTCKWIWKVKEDQNGNVARYKARLVARGFSQQYGIDYTETFAPVVKFTTLRTMLAVATIKGYDIKQYDISNAYLNSTVTEEIYMEQPEGFKQYDTDGTELFCKLKKSLYGLKQAAKNWNELITRWFTSHEFVQSKADPCLFTYNKGEVFIAATIYVDDIVSVTNDGTKHDQVMEEMSKTFKLTDQGGIRWLLGTEINQEPEALTIHQRKYLNEVLLRYGMANSKPAATPIEQSGELPEPEDTKKRTDRSLYLGIAGSLNYLSVVSRPDISYAISKAGEHMADPGERDLIAIKRILRYLNGHKDYAIKFKMNSGAQLVGYCDSDWAGDKEHRKSTTGYVFILAGGPISWSSKHQTVVALSSTEAEYIALSSATQEAMFLAQILADLDYAQGSITIHSDNQGSIKLASNNSTSARTKHIDIRHHFVRDAIAAGKINIKYIPSENQPADILTKPVKRISFDAQVERIFGTKVDAENEGGC